MQGTVSTLALVKWYNASYEYYHLNTRKMMAYYNKLEESDGHHSRNALSFYKKSRFSGDVEIR